MSIIDGGFLNHNWKQLYTQLADSASGGAYSFVGTLIIVFTLKKIGDVWAPMRLRASPEDEIEGMDDLEIGEFAVSGQSYQEAGIFCGGRE